MRPMEFKICIARVDACPTRTWKQLQKHIDPISHNEVWGPSTVTMRSVAAGTCRKIKNKTKKPTHLGLNSCLTGDHPMTSQVKQLNSRKGGEQESTDCISSAITVKVMKMPAGTVGASAARKTDGQQTAHTHKTLTNSGAGNSRGLWQNAKWLPGWVGSGWTVTRPCHGRLLCFCLDGFLFKGHGCR